MTPSLTLVKPRSAVIQPRLDQIPAGPLGNQGNVCLPPFSETQLHSKPSHLSLFFLPTCFVYYLRDIIICNDPKLVATLLLYYNLRISCPDTAMSYYCFAQWELLDVSQQVSRVSCLHSVTLSHIPVYIS